MDDIKLRYVLMQDNMLGIEDILNNNIKVVAEYSAASDVMHIHFTDEFKELDLKKIPPLSAARMSKLLGKNIIALYVELT